MIGAWILCVILLALAVGSLYRFQVAGDTSGRFVAGTAAMVTGVVGLVFLVVLIL